MDDQSKELLSDIIEDYSNEESALLMMTPKRQDDSNDEETTTETPSTVADVTKNKMSY